MNDKMYSNNNNLLLGIINELQQIMNYSNDNIIIKRISDIIIKMNFIINDNKKNTELIIKHINNLQNQMIQNFNKLQNNNKQEIKYNDGKYIGQVINGIREGKGILYLNNGNRYEGYWKNDNKNDNKNGIGNMYLKKGDRYEGEWKNGKFEGKGIKYWNKGDRYEGEWKNDKREGKGIYYYNNGNRRMGDYYNDKPIGKHVLLTNNGDVKIENY